MPRFQKNQSLSEFQAFVKDVYGLPNDRSYSLESLLTQQQRFSMRALKGIRKRDKEKIKFNLLISLSWFMSIANRLHIDVEDCVWKRFPMLCSYCAGKPCRCRKIKPSKRQKVRIDNALRPHALSEFQEMFRLIYPVKSRTLADAGVHLAEEMGEVAEAIHHYYGQHLHRQFNDIRYEIADFMSCAFGVANSAEINVAEELGKMFSNNCHVCHKAPCVCSFSFVSKIET